MLRSLLVPQATAQKAEERMGLIELGYCSPLQPEWHGEGPSRDANTRMASWAREPRLFKV
jgi:hypothetical protein